MNTVKDMVREECRNLTFEKAIALAFDDEKRSELNEVETMGLCDLLDSFALRTARALDKVHGIDSRACRGQHPGYGGTPNKKSYTYKVRKALGFSYP